MCLLKISKDVPKSTGVGYKTFRVDKGKLFGVLSDGKPRPVGKWIKARKYTPTRFVRKYVLGSTKRVRIKKDGKTVYVGYKPGWHIYKNEIDASVYPMFTIRYRKAYVQGHMSLYTDYPVIVAEEIYILEDK